MDPISYTSSTEFDWEDHSYVLLRKLGPKTVELQANAADCVPLPSNCCKSQTVRSTPCFTIPTRRLGGRLPFLADHKGAGGGAQKPVII